MADEAVPCTTDRTCSSILESAISAMGLEAFDDSADTAGVYS